MPSTYSALIPGPFILLLLLPSIPLLLFSIGARPPDTSALPFSMTEVFTTAAFVSIAGGVVLGLVVWPEMGSNVGGWIRGGAVVNAGIKTVGPGPSVTWWDRIKGGTAGKGGYMAQYSGRTGQAQYQGSVGTKVASKMRIPKTQAGRAAARMYAIRSKFIQLYNPHRPHTPTALGIICLLLAILVVVAGNFMRSIYELDAAPASKSGSSSGSSKDGGELTPWVMAEIKKRQSELKAGKTPEQTLARYMKDAEGERKQLKEKVEGMDGEKAKAYRERKEKERTKELKVLLGQLEKLKLTTVGVEGADKVGTEAGGGTGDGATEAGGGSSGGDTASRGWKKRWGMWYPKGKDKPPKEKKESVPIGERVKRAILPVPLSSVGSGITREQARRDAAMWAGGAQAMPARGPGWEMADNPQAEAALAQSAGNAESLAAKMKAGG